MSVLEALTEGGNKTEWRHDIELTLTSIARSDLELKSSIRQPKNNSFKYKWKGRMVMMSPQNNCRFVAGWSY